MVNPLPSHLLGEPLEVTAPQPLKRRQTGADVTKFKFVFKKAVFPAALLMYPIYLDGRGAFYFYEVLCFKINATECQQKYRLWIPPGSEG